MRNKLLEKMAVIAISTALYFIFARFTITLGANMKISLSGLPVLIVCVLYGPIEGACVGLLGAFLGQMLSYGFTATTILWILPPALRGIVYGFLIKIKDTKEKMYFHMIFSIIAGLIVTITNTLVLFVDSKIYGYFSMTLIFGDLIYRFLLGILTSVVIGILVYAIYKAVKHIRRD